MPTMDEIPQSDDPVHLLLVADSKVGKSVYAAQAAIDGFELLYVDSDNGISACRWAIKNANAPEALRRIHYYPTKRPVEFMKALLRSTMSSPMVWNARTDRQWNKMSMDTQPTDSLWIFDITKMPRSWVLVQDSWTSAAGDALGIGHAAQPADILDEDANKQAIYGDANGNLTFIANMFQKLSSHCIVQAHGTVYERYDKPLNMTPAQSKQKDFILKEIMEVPISSSRPHGKEMASRFNHIGWLAVDGLGDVTIDFTKKMNRIGGGPPNIIMKAKDLPFSRLTGGVPPRVEAPGFIEETTVEEFLKRASTITTLPGGKAVNPLLGGIKLPS